MVQPYNHVFKGSASLKFWNKHILYVIKRAEVKLELQENLIQQNIMMQITKNAALEHFVQSISYPLHKEIKCFKKSWRC